MIKEQSYLSLYAKSSSEMHMCMLDNVSSRGLKKCYCPCGRIVSLDTNSVKLKLSLGKVPLCMTCRNEKISKEIDEINMIYDGISEDDEYLIY